MIMIGSFYRLETPQGIRTIKCMQYDADNNPYGIYSTSDYKYEGDNQGMIIPVDSKDANEYEIIAWEKWYNEWFG